MKTKRSFFDLDTPFIIAVDGEAASGKGTFCTKLAKEYNLFYCQTSIFYRKLAKIAIDRNITDVEELVKIASHDDLQTISDKDLYFDEVSKRASEIASIKEVRFALNIPQKEMLKLHKRIIMEGRDIGTVIAPTADVKLYFTANVNARAQRRFAELVVKDQNITLESIKNNIIDRDIRDKERENAPLSIAKDAIIIDSSELDADQVYNKVLHILEKS